MVMVMVVVVVFDVGTYGCVIIAIACVRYTRVPKELTAYRVL